MFATQGDIFNRDFCGVIEVRVPLRDAKHVTSNWCEAMARRGAASEASAGPCQKKGRALDHSCWIIWARPIWPPALRASIYHMQRETLPLFLQCKHIYPFDVHTENCSLFDSFLPIFGQNIGIVTIARPIFRHKSVLSGRNKKCENADVFLGVTPPSYGAKATWWLFKPLSHTPGSTFPG